MRTYEHVIDTKAVKQTLNTIPDYCVVRELTERDYGIDLLIEIFKKTGQDRNNHPFYDSTGHVCYLQIKGTGNKLHINKDNTISVSIEKKALLYMEKFATPFILVRTCVYEKNKTSYFLWLQRYISDVMDVEQPSWRSKKQESFSVRIPVKNNLKTNFQKIERIAARIKYIDEHSEFFEKYSLMRVGFEGMYSRTFTRKQYNRFLIDLNRIKNLTTLLELNNCQVNKDDIEELIGFVKKMRIRKKNSTGIMSLPNPLIENLEMLLNDNHMRQAMEEIFAENDGDTTY